MKAPASSAPSCQLILAALQLRSPKGATRRQIEQAFPILHKRTIRAALQTLHQGKLIERRLMDHPAYLYFASASATVTSTAA